jgi:hypothetical protein
LKGTAILALGDQTLKKENNRRRFMEKVKVQTFEIEKKNQPSVDWKNVAI